MRVFTLQLQKELHELWRTRKLLIVAVVLLAFGLMSPIFAKITPDLVKSLGEGQSNVTIILPDPSVRDAIDQFIKNTTQFGLLLAVLMSFGAIAGERAQLALMFTHPLPRATFVLAKFAGLAILFGVGLLLGAAADYLYTVILFEAPDVGGFVAMVGLLYLWLLCLIALSLLASTLGRSVTGAGGIAFVFVVVLLIAGALTNLAPDSLLNWGQRLATEAGGPDRWGALLITLTLIVIGVGGSSLILQRQEIGG